ncbi:MAG: hypothetical protein JKY70_14850 [Mucilaginibacter sp.]|nr:hypothetical protein [Mucilaginibacter sp.]
MEKVWKSCKVGLEQIKEFVGDIALTELEFSIIIEEKMINFSIIGKPDLIDGFLQNIDLIFTEEYLSSMADGTNVMITYNSNENRWEQEIF